MSLSVAHYIRITIVALVLAAATAILLPLQLLAILFKDPVANHIPQYWHKIACWILGARIKIVGNIPKERPLMLVANHSSWLDILVLGAVMPVVFIAKDDVAAWPIFGHLAKLQRTIFIDRTRSRQAGEQAKIIAKRMQEGDIVVLFPEGTTSDGNYILPFKSSLFGAAKFAQNELPDHALYIQPVAVAYVSAHGVPLGRTGRDLVGWPGDVELLPHLKNIILESSLGVEITFCEPVLFDQTMRRAEIAKICETHIARAHSQSLR